MDAGNGYSVMVVDDDVQLREALTDLLCDEGYEVFTAGNGSEALDILEHRLRATTLILLDMLMPVMDGATFRSEQLTDPVLAHIPVLILSATFDCQSMTSLRAAGCLQKPFKPEALLQLIDHVCHAKA